MALVDPAERAVAVKAEDYFVWVLVKRMAAVPAERAVAVVS